jgi:hypothetical protein
MFASLFIQGKHELQKLMSVPNDLIGRMNLPWTYFRNFHWNEVSVKTYSSKIIFKNEESLLEEYLIKCKRSIMC